MLKPLSSLAMKAHAWIWPNRASDPKDEDVIERSYPYFKDAWSGKRSESWYLEVMAVRPDFQGKQVGKKLVTWGLNKANEDGVCASVISAWKKDDFYKKCGFNEQFGSAAKGPLVGVEGCNIYWKWPGDAAQSSE